MMGRPLRTTYLNTTLGSTLGPRRLRFPQVRAGTSPPQPTFKAGSMPLPVIHRNSPWQRWNVTILRLAIGRDFPIFQSRAKAWQRLQAVMGVFTLWVEYRSP